MIFSIATILFTVRIVPPPEDLRFTVYPNPCKSGQDLIFRNIPNKCQLRIYNIAGELVAQEDCDSPVHLFNPKNLAQGVYFWLVENKGKEKKSGKVVILR